MYFVYITCIITQDDPIRAMVNRVAEHCKVTDTTIIHNVITEMFEQGLAYDNYHEVIKAVELNLQVSV